MHEQIATRGRVTHTQAELKAREEAAAKEAAEVNNDVPWNHCANGVLTTLSIGWQAKAQADAAAAAAAAAAEEAKIAKLKAAVGFASMVAPFAIQNTYTMLLFCRCTSLCQQSLFQKPFHQMFRVGSCAVSMLTWQYGGRTQSFRAIN